MGSPFAIFAHAHQSGPVPRPGKCIKQQPDQLEASPGREEAVEIGQTVGEAVGDTFDAMEWKAAHGGETGHSGGFHVDKGGSVGGGEAAFFGFIGDPGAGGEPEGWSFLRG